MPWTEPRTWVPGEVPGATEFNTHVRDNLRAILPVGSLIHRVAVATAVETVVENRFLECNGVAVSRVTYATLFTYLNGLTPALPFGAGDGTNTFNLPDLRGRVVVAVNSAGGHADSSTLGGNEGEAIAKRTPKHWHEFIGRTGAIGVGPYTQGNSTPTTFGTLLGGTAPKDAPAYLVAGIWYIKYTS